MDNSPSDISPYPAPLGLELGVGLVGFGVRVGSVGLWLGLVALVLGLGL